MKKIIFMFFLLFSSSSYSDDLNCNAVYKDNALGGGEKTFEISQVKKISENHYDLKLKLNGTIRQKLDNFPNDKTHTLIDIKCLDKENERQLKELLKL